jgi:hypothetical protein
VGLKSETKGSKEIMFGRNPFGKDFPMHVSVLIDEIKSELDIKSAAIDLQALVEIDKKINALHERKAFNEKYFLNMIALIGEVFIHEKQPHATWEMQLATDYTSWNPSIKYDNRNIDFLGYLYEDLFLDTPTPPNELLNIYETINGISKNK